MKGIKNIIFDFNKEILTDRAFKKSITMSVVGIILCMIALCSTTFAWFNASVSSNTNSIQAANCIVTVSVANSGTAEDIANGQYTFKKDTIYDVTVTASGTAKSAYCIFYVKRNRKKLAMDILISRCNLFYCDLWKIQKSRCKTHI